MQQKSPFPAFVASPVLPLTAGAIALGIFVVDTFTILDIAIAVLYVVVVLMAANFLGRRGVLLVSSACLALTVLSYLVSHGLSADTALARCLVSLSAIGIATVLALKNQSAHQVLREQARLLDLTHDTIFVRDMNDIITYWNRGAEELYGWKGEQAIGKVSHELMRTIFPVRLEEIVAELLRTNRWEGELVHSKRDGTQVVVSSRWSLQRNEQGQPGAVLETNTDITERKRAEAKAQEHQKELQLTIDSIPTLAWHARADGFAEYLNRRWIDYTGLSLEEASGWGWQVAVHPEDRTRLLDAWRTILNAGGRAEIEARLRRFDGEYRWFLFRAEPVRDTLGNIVRWYGTNTDIERRKRAEDALHQAQAELAHVTRVTTLGELTASIAHEVNQPLAGIVINGEASLRWLAHEVPEIGEARRAVERIISDAGRASNVIRRIRDLSKKAAPEMARLDINDVIDEALLLVQRQALSHRVTVRLELASGLPAVLGDRVQLQQVIINLVINGIEAMALVTDRPRELVVRSHQYQGDQVLVAVQDFGVGIEPENANRLFSAFYTTKPDGMGMGLSICRSIVEAHGGRVWASGNVGPGATIQFTLPRHRETAAQ